MAFQIKDFSRQHVISYFILTVIAAFGLLRAFNGSFNWAFFAFLTVVIAVAPAVIERDLTAIIPPELLVLAATPYFISFISTSNRIAIEIMAFIAILSLAIIITSEIHLFSDVKMTRRFSAFFVIIVTSAMASVWTVAQFFSDLWFNTPLLGSKEEMMWEIIFATVFGAFGGIIYQHYLKHTDISGAMKGENST